MVAVPDREVEEGGVGGELGVSEGQWRTAGAAPVPGYPAGSCTRSSPRTQTDLGRR